MPVLCGSALDHVGVQPVLDAVQYYLPSPADKPPVTGTNPKKKDAPTTRKPNKDEPFCGLVFKIQADKHGDLCFVRVYSGTLPSGSRIYNPGNDKKENVSQLWHIQSDRREQISEVEAGDIVGIIGLRHSVTGDTIFEKDSIRMLVQAFADPAVGAVAGNVKVGNRERMVAAWQHIEYVIGFNLDSRLYEVLNCVPTVPGAIGAFRREALAQVGGVSDETLAEDTDVTMAMCRAGWRAIKSFTCGESEPLFVGAIFENGFSRSFLRRQ